MDNILEPIAIFIGNNESKRKRYYLSERAISSFHESLLGLIDKSGAIDICDVGGGANPELSQAEIIERGLRYTLLDISEPELKKAESGYSLLVADAGGAMPPKKEAFDLVFSKMLAEHIVDGAAFHRNMFAMLRPGGIAFHFFPTLYAFPYVINRLLPEKLALSILEASNLTRDLKGRMGKFPAYYSWCRGPTPSQIRKFESIGFIVLDYIGFFGYDGYYKKFPKLLYVHRYISRLLLRKQVSWLTSFSYVVLRRPTS